MIITPHQRELLKGVRIADQARRAAKATIDQEARVWKAERLAQFDAQRDLAVRFAYEAGVPKKQISEDGLFTTARITLDRILARTEATR